MARAEASAVLTEASPQLGLDEAFFSNVPQMVGLEIPLGALGVQNTNAAPSVITPVPPSPVEFTATELSVGCVRPGPRARSRGLGGLPGPREP